MLSELRTSLLGPRNYYDLYITATDELRHMEAFFEAEQKRGRRMLELYELVQHAGNVLPRLYLLLAVGSGGAIPLPLPPLRLLLSWAAARRRRLDLCHLRPPPPPPPPPPICISSAASSSTASCSRSSTASTAAAYAQSTS